MKTTISLPDDVFKQAEHLAKRLRLSRSQLYAKAVAEFVSRHSPDDVTAAFNRVCAECHGTYGTDGKYPEKMVPIEDVGTDRVRLDALTPQHRDAYGQSWFADFGRKTNISAPPGYVAPPLDGVWASAPYFHNGSVPTLWHVFHPKQRPAVWTRSSDGYDTEKLGPKIKELDSVPPEAATGWQRRQYFDTRAFGKSAAGHDFPDALSELEKQAVLEYLKTL